MKSGGGVTLHRAVTADPRAVVDPVRFRQIVGNLLANAIWHTPHGGRVDMHARTERGYLVIDVADTGEGITATDALTTGAEVSARAAGLSSSRADSRHRDGAWTPNVSFGYCIKRVARGA